MKLFTERQNWLLLPAAAATMLCIVYMLVIVGISGTDHLGYMLFNMALIGGAWFFTLKENASGRGRCQF